MTPDKLWLRFGTAACAAVMGAVVATAQQPDAQQRGTQPPDTQPPDTQAAAPDGDFIEFLGADDDGDPAWWEFLKKAAPRKDETPAPPSQDAKP